MKAIDMFIDMFLEVFFYTVSIAIGAIILVLFYALCCLPPWAIFGATGWLLNVNWQWSWVAAGGILLAVFLLWWGSRSYDKAQAAFEAQEKIDDLMASLGVYSVEAKLTKGRPHQYVTLFLKSPSRFNN